MFRQFIRRIVLSTVALIVVSSCNPLRGPVIETRDDGEILGTLTISRGQYRRGELVEVSFTIKNISDETVVLEREDGPVQDLLLSAVHGERSWVDETGKIEAFRSLRLGPGEESTIDWALNDLETDRYGLVGRWWSGNIREFIVVARTSYGPTRR
jgi:hypothetical protein